jgi:heme exporter protein D
MDLGPYTGFILAAYAVFIGIVLVLIAWVQIDHRAQRRRLAELEARGITRRSAQRELERP